MIKARGLSNDGTPMILLGLSHENVARLCADQPILVCTALPPPAGLSMTDGPDIILVVGSDERAIVAKLREAGFSEVVEP